MSMDTAPRTHRFIAADFLTPGYRVVGKMLVSNTGAMGMINDTNNSFMEVHDAKLARLHMPTKLVDHYEIVRLVKKQIFAICLARREDVGPVALARGGFTKVVEYPVRMTSEVYELQGTLEWPGRFDFGAIMSEGTRNFIPLYTATLTAILIPSLRIESDAVLFNRDQVDLLALLNQRVKPAN